MLWWCAALPGEGRRKGIRQKRQRDEHRRDKIQGRGKCGNAGCDKGAGLGKLMAKAAMIWVGRIVLLGRGGRIADRVDGRKRRRPLVKMALKRQALKEKGQQREQRDVTPRRGEFHVKAGGD